MVHVGNLDSEQITEWSGISVFYFATAATKDNTDLERIVYAGVVWFQKKNDAGWFADDEQITFTDETVIGRNVTKQVGHRIQQVWKETMRVPAGKYYPIELARAIRGGGIGLPADCKVSLGFNIDNSHTSTEITSAVEIDGVNYVPTELVVDGKTYMVLAAETNEDENTVVPTDEPTADEPTEGENNG